MEYTFLKEDFESIMLFVSAPVYLVILSILQSKNLAILARIKNKKLSKDQVQDLLLKLSKLKLKAPLFVLIGTVIHVLGYLLFSDFLRYGYFISVMIMYFIYLSIAWVNFYLRGAGVMKDLGEFGGLPGN